jgi:hypothetical protein
LFSSKEEEAQLHFSKLVLSCIRRLGLGLFAG